MSGQTDRKKSDTVEKHDEHATGWMAGLTEDVEKRERKNRIERDGNGREMGQNWEKQNGKRMALGQNMEKNWTGKGQKPDGRIQYGQGRAKRGTGRTWDGYKIDMGWTEDRHVMEDGQGTDMGPEMAKTQDGHRTETGETLEVDVMGKGWI